MDPRPRLTNDPDLAATTFAVIDFEATTPVGARPEPIDVAAIQLRLNGGTWVQAGRFSQLMRPPQHAPLTPFDTAQTGITPQMVAAAEPAAVVLAALDAAFASDQPCLLVAHHASTEAGMLHDYRDHCPNLAHTDLLDTVKLARVLYPQLPSHKLDTLLAHLGIPQPPGRHRALPTSRSAVPSDATAAPTPRNSGASTSGPPSCTRGWHWTTRRACRSWTGAPSAPGSS